MSALAKTTPYQQSSSSVTSISVNSRIDYILRFSKEAVLVVDENENNLSQISSQFLSTFSDVRNAAFITLSPKHNDIQLRCRIIEQLFSGLLFDPEQSLAVSVINHLKKRNESISIVIEQAQLLSLQLMYELCQLAEIAKKSQLNVDVLMLGSVQAGATAAQSKGLFSKKVSIVDGRNGQLISLNASVFNQSHFSVNRKNVLKLVCIFIALISILAGGLFALQQQELLAFSEPNQATDVIVKTDSFVSATKNVTIDLSLKQATPGEILAALTLSPDRFTLRKRNTQKAIVDSLSKEPSVVTPSKVSVLTAKEQPAIKRPTTNDEALNYQKSEAKPNDAPITATKRVTFPVREINEQYYLAQKSGFVIQLGGFAQNAIFREFKADYNDVTFFGYKRSLDGGRFIVVTSPIYADKASAEVAFARLPKSLLEKGPWIKSLEAVNNEIVQYQQTN